MPTRFELRLFHGLPNSAPADESLAEWAEHVGKMVEPVNPTHNLIVHPAEQHFPNRRRRT